MTTTEESTIESVESFRERAVAWVSENLQRVTPAEAAQLHDYEDEQAVATNRALMAKLFDAGFSGICFPREYGGQGLTVEHLRAFTDASLGYGLPFMFHLPTMTILAPTLLDFATEEQKRRHIPAILRGDELWVQFLSEPSGGSDLAAVLTRASRDGDVYVLNGSKIWSSSAYRSDYALCVCRTNWDVPKHRGISVLIVKVDQPGIQIEQIRQVDGTREFCQEFFDDVPIPVENVIGDENDGWTIATKLLQHEKLAVGGGSPYGLVVGGSGGEGADSDRVARIASAVGRSADPSARAAVGESAVLRIVQRAVVERVAGAIASGAMPPSAASILKLFNATTGVRRAELAAIAAGPALVAGDRAAGAVGVQFLARQGAALAGGSNEIQRNIISERVLGMPREAAADRDVPFKDVPRGAQR
ncbi:MAG TPA: acyl-CoA dehydrogenase family protein [Acidimicrobiia bacterium]|nr:acyl-CoA dehydrogenase family protein [Acidimicrobiia bacterium]